MLSGIPDYGAAEVTAITSGGAVAEEDATLQGPIPFPFSNGQPKEDLVLPNGKHLVAGYANGNWAMARYNGNGSLDTTFGSGGKLLTGIGRAPTFGCVAVILEDGRIHVTGLLDGVAKAMECDANGKNGFDRLANKPSMQQPLSAALRFTRCGSLGHSSTTR